MKEIEHIEAQLSFLERWIEIASSSLLGLYDRHKSFFPRELPAEKASTGAIPSTRVTTRSTPATSTNRSFFALREYLRYLEQEDIKDVSKRNRVMEVLVGVARRLVHDPESMRDSSNGENMFTDSHFLVSVSLLPGLKTMIPSFRANVTSVRPRAERVAVRVRRDVERWLGGKANEFSDSHDFVTLHAVRSLDLFQEVFRSRRRSFSERLENRIRENVLRLLAYHTAGVSSRFDPNELMFSVSLLNRFPTPDVPSLTARSVQAIVESQASDDAWPAARLVANKGRGLLHVASFEVALALAQLVIRKLSERDTSICQSAFSALSRSFELIKSHYNVVSHYSGWCNDHSRRYGVIESWSTAIVLTLLIHYRDALLTLRQHLVLIRLRAEEASIEPRPQTWPDLLLTVHNVHSIRLEPLRQISDPSNESRLSDALRDKFVQPAKDNWLHRPSKTSILLYGPPGTRKTSLVKKLAEALGWPFVVLSPPWFLRRGGIDGFEACAAEIFDDLLRLRRVVVLFDECEDFFKARMPEQKLESRTTGAFITAGMLPRLQTLRDKRWVLFVLNTNSKLNELDDAATRPGRFDFQYEMGHPTLNAQIQYLRRKQLGKGPRIKALEKALAEYQQSIDDRTAGKDAKPISFFVLDELISRITNKRSRPTPSTIRLSIEKLAGQTGPPSLV